LNLRIPPIYAITDRPVSGIADHAEMASRLFKVGVRLLQVREKAMPDCELLGAVESVVAEGRKHGATVLINDRVDIARIAGVGAHLGEEDLPSSVARELLSPGALVGVSTHEREAARRAFTDPSSDYVSFGPVFASGTKMIRPPRGLEELARVAAEKTKPLVAIGGITSENLDEVLDAGADCAAMIAGLLAEGRIEENARRTLDRVRQREFAGRLYLVGFMGSGKTAVGERIAKRLEVPFVDLDQEIERTSGVTIRALFAASGEAAFREREGLFLRGTESLPRAVVATGAGCFAREENRERIRQLGTAVFLDVALPVIRARLAGKTDRPLFQNAEQAAGLFAERAPFYKMGTIRVELSGRETIDEAADRVLSVVFDRSPEPAIL